MGVRFVIRTAEGLTPGDDFAYSFDQARIVIGRGPGADVRIPHLTVSENHAAVRSDGEGHAVVDNDSTNGTSVNGVRLVPGRAKTLREGDRIEVGAYVLSFHYAAPARTTTIERTAELARRLFRSSQAGGGVRGPRLCVLTGPATGKSADVPPPPARLLVGSAASCQLMLADAAVAGEHIELAREPDGVVLTNLDPKNVVEVNNQRVTRRRLRDGDDLVLGSTALLFEDPAEEPIETLTGEPDRLLGRAAPAETAVREDDPPAARARGPRQSFDADLLIYTLAGVVIAVSLAALFFLLQQP